MAGIKFPVQENGGTGVESSSACAEQMNAKLTELQAMVLTAAIEGKPLPGTNSAVQLADAAFLRENGEILLAEEGINRVALARRLPAEIKVLSKSLLIKRAATQPNGRLAYLQFANVKERDDMVRFTLETRIVSPETGNQPATLGGIDLSFRKKADGSWVAIDAPAAFAS